MSIGSKTPGSRKARRARTSANVNAMKTRLLRAATLGEYGETVANLRASAKPGERNQVHDAERLALEKLNKPAG